MGVRAAAALRCCQSCCWASRSGPALTTLACLRLAHPPPPFHPLLPPVCSNLYDVFINIRDDELEHFKTVVACQDGSLALDLQVCAAAMRRRGHAAPRAPSARCRGACGAPHPSRTLCPASLCPLCLQNMRDLEEFASEQGVASLPPWSSCDLEDAAEEAEAGGAAQLPPGGGGKK